MRASTSVSSTSRGWTRAVPVAAGAYLAAHLPFLAPSLEDIDSINFALGLRVFSVVDHQPHPPGYPVFIALGRVSFRVISTLAPSLPQAHAEALALAVWSAVAGAVAIAAAHRVFRALDVSGAPSRTALWGALLLGVAPLFWMSGLRPMSDLSGLAVVLVSQALALESEARPRRLVTSALLAGLAAGIRSQSVILTVPVLLWAAVRARSQGAFWLITRPVAALAAGGLAWAVPLVVLSGGLRAYLAALASQAGEDFAWVDMLWLNPTPRQLALALRNTFVVPWAMPALAAVVSLTAVVGAGYLLRRQRRALVLLVVTFLPYALFHVLLQETPHVRYALPLLVPVAYLASRGADLLGRFAPVVTTALIAASLWTAVPATLAYAREPHPAFRAIDAIARAAAEGDEPMLFQHFANRRPLQAATPAHVRLVEPRRNQEWLGAVEYWREGGTAPVWFLADPRRTDLELIDPHARRSVTRYAWAVADRPELGGARPTNVDWYRFGQPAWFAGEGWSLTPELAGLARAAGLGIHRKPLEAWVLRRPGLLRLVVGGRHLEGAPRTVRFSLSIDQAIVGSWTFAPTRGGDGFLQFIDVSAGVPPGAGPYAPLTISAAAVDGGPTPVVAIEQFDARPDPGLVYGFGDGWHEAEYDTADGRRWRWTSDRSVLRVMPARAFTLHVRGESPLRYFDTPPRVRVTSGVRTLAEFVPRADFEWRVPVSASDVEAGEGAVAIETDRVYLPGPSEGTSDARRLGLRLFEVALEPAATQEP